MIEGYCWTCGKFRTLNKSSCMCKPCVDAFYEALAKVATRKAIPV